MPKGVYIRNESHRISLSNNAKKNTKIRGGGYHAVHKWIAKYYGKADRCEGLECNGESKRYYWAKVIGKDYEHDRSNFIMLCGVCHKNYDMTPEIGKKISNAKKGKKLSESHRKNISISMKNNFTNNKSKTGI